MKDNPQELHQKIVEISRAHNSTNLALGEYLLYMKEDNRYQEVSGEGSTWGEYLASPEVKLKTSSAYRYMAIVKKYIVELGLKYEDLYGLDTPSLYYCVKVINKDNHEEWLEKIKTLSRSDIEHLIKFGDKDQMACEHQFEPVPTKWKCKICGTITQHNPNQ